MAHRTFSIPTHITRIYFSKALAAIASRPGRARAWYAALTFKIAVVSVCLLSASVQAVPVFTNDLNGFYAQLDATAKQYVLNFEAEALVGTAKSGGVKTLSFPELTIQSAMPALKILNKSYTGNHNTTLGGSQYLSLDTELKMGTDLWMQFAKPVYALGFNVIDHDTGDVTIDVAGSSFVLPDVKNGDEVFFGLIFDDPLDQISQIFLNSGKDGQIAIDDLILAYWPDKEIATPVSGPETGWLLFAAIGLLLLRRQTLAMIC